MWSIESRSSEPQSDGSVRIRSERGRFRLSWSSQKTRYVRSLPLAKPEESLSDRKLTTSPRERVVRALDLEGKWLMSSGRNLEMLSGWQNVNLLPSYLSKHVPNKPQPATIAVVKFVMSHIAPLSNVKRLACLYKTCHDHVSLVSPADRPVETETSGITQMSLFVQPWWMIL